MVDGVFQTCEKKDLNLKLADSTNILGSAILKSQIF